MSQSVKYRFVRDTEQPEPTARSTGFRWLIAMAILTVGVWHLPGRNYILYPFTIMATWFHEMGHGLMALFPGGSFSKLLIFHDGSGVAY